MSGARRRLRTTFGSLEVRNYRIFFVVQLISVTGTWMQSVAQSWLVLKLTGSGVALGVTAGLQFLPILLFASVGGLLADRADKRRLLVMTQTAAAMLALLLAALTLTGTVRLWMVWALAFGLGWVNVFDNPTRQSFVIEMVGRRHLANAVSLNSAVFTSARVIGPAVAGVLIAWVGTGWCFAYNGLSYLPVVLGLLAMRKDELEPSERVRRGRGQLMEGLRYAWSRPDLRLPLLLMLVIGTLSLNFSVLLPLMASREFHGGPDVFGLMLSVMGAGSLAGALAAASRRLPGSRLLSLAAGAFGILLVGAAVAPNLPLELLVLVPMGAFMVTVQATANSILQLNSDPSFRGRVMALYITVFIGTTPVGGPIVGFVAERFGARAGLALGGVAAVIAAAVALAALRGRRALEEGPAEPEPRGAEPLTNTPA